MHRFYSESIRDAVTERQNAYPVGPQFEQRLRNGETIETDQYSIVTLKIAGATKKRQQQLMFEP